MTMIRIVVPGRPLSKSNFRTHNPRTGKRYAPGAFEKYDAYEQAIAWACVAAYRGPQIQEPTIAVLRIFLQDRRALPDIHNLPKSICDGIEKSGIIQNDKILRPMVLDGYYFDKAKPRVEIELYPASRYELVYSVRER